MQNIVFVLTTEGELLLLLLWLLFSPSSQALHSIMFRLGLQISWSSYSLDL